MQVLFAALKSCWTELKDFVQGIKESCSIPEKSICIYLHFVPALTDCTLYFFSFYLHQQKHLPVLLVNYYRMQKDLIKTC